MWVPWKVVNITIVQNLGMPKFGLPIDSYIIEPGGLCTSTLLFHTTGTMTEHLPILKVPDRSSSCRCPHRPVKFMPILVFTYPKHAILGASWIWGNGWLPRWYSHLLFHLHSVWLSIHTCYWWRGWRGQDSPHLFKNISFLYYLSSPYHSWFSPTKTTALHSPYNRFRFCWRRTRANTRKH